MAQHHYHVSSVITPLFYDQTSIRALTSCQTQWDHVDVLAQEAASQNNGVLTLVILTNLSGPDAYRY